MPVYSEKWKWKEVAQSCQTLCDPMDCSPAGSSVHGISQARILEWVTISFARWSSRPRDGTRVSHTVESLGTSTRRFQRRSMTVQMQWEKAGPRVCEGCSKWGQTLGATTKGKATIEGGGAPGEVRLLGRWNRTGGIWAQGVHWFWSRSYRSTRALSTESPFSAPHRSARTGRAPFLTI